MELGGNIELFGLDECSDNDLIVIKKIVGHFAKHFTEKYPGFEGLRVTFDHEDGKHIVKGTVVLGDELYETQSPHNNLYFALDATLKELVAQTEA